jgi:hypothetical protein
MIKPASLRPALRSTGRYASTRAAPPPPRSALVTASAIFGGIVLASVAVSQFTHSDEKRRLALERTS